MYLRVFTKFWNNYGAIVSSGASIGTAEDVDPNNDIALPSDLAKVECVLVLKRVNLLVLQRIRSLGFQEQIKTK